MMGNGRGAGILRIRFIVLPGVALAGAGWSAVGSAALPSPEQLAPNTVARVAEAPKKAGTVTRAEFRRTLAQVAVTEGRRRPPRPGSRGYGQLMRIAVDELLEAAWLKGQAAEMHIAVTRRQVQREHARLKKETFRSAAEYRQFLREARYTRRDIYERVELQLLSERIGRRVENQAKKASRKQGVFDEFVEEFEKRWRARTVCAPAYVTQRCSNHRDATSALP